MPNKELLERYKNDTKLCKVSNGFLISYKGSQYSVPPKFINKTVKVRELNNKLYIYYNEELIASHEISEYKINYRKEHYSEGLMYAIKDNNIIKKIDEIVERNLELISKLSEVK